MEGPPTAPADSIKLALKKVSYPECSKLGNHTGELTNLICLEPSCKEDNLCCCVCIEDNHKLHNTRPLKVVLSEIADRISKVKQQPLSTEELMVLIETTRTTLMQEFKDMAQQWIAKAKEIEHLYDIYFKRISDQVVAKSSSTETIMGLIASLQESQLSIDTLKSAVNKLLDFMPLEVDAKESELADTKTVRENIVTATKSIKDVFDQNNNSIKQILRAQKEIMEQKLQENIFAPKINFFFSDFKHQNVTIVNQTIAKSHGGSAGYKFAIMTPSIEDKGNRPRTLAFRMKELNQSNWVAIGVCHKNLIVSKNYSFPFQQLGHGAYMISSNGGTWSHTHAASNNVIKAFKFAKNDIVSAEYDPLKMAITFYKESPGQQNKENFKLELKAVDGDPLCPCVLFYYLNDEVEFLNNYQISK